MRIPRIYYSCQLRINDTVTLDVQQTHYLCNVLRLKTEDKIHLFFDNYIYPGVIQTSRNNKFTILITDKIYSNNELNSTIHLGQVLCKKDKMDWIIQKSVELGVNVITPLYSRYCDIKLSKSRALKKLEHWQKIIIAACEQCGRNKLPHINDIVPLEQWCAENNSITKMIFYSSADNQLNKISFSNDCSILIGPEGGFHRSEIVYAQQNDFSEVSLTKYRILRAETASISAISILQFLLNG